MIGPRAPAAAGEALRLLLRLLARGGVDDGRSPGPAPGPPSASASAASTRRSRSRAPVTSTARRARLGRAKPRTICGVSAGRPSRARISSRTIGVAVAVQASTRAAPSSASSAADPEVLRPEVVPPLADAVRLVDGDQRALEVAQEPAEAVEGQALRRRVDEVEAPRRHLRHAAAHLAGVERGREERRRHAPGLERLHLIGHERDERRDDEGRAGQHRGGELVDQALAAARGRDQQQPPALEQGLDRLALAGAKARVPEPGERRVEARRSRRRPGLSD